MLHFLEALFGEVEAASEETRVLAIANHKFAPLDSLYG